MRLLIIMVTRAQTTILGRRQSTTLRKFVEDRNLNKTDLAQRAGMKREQLRRVLNGINGGGFTGARARGLYMALGSPDALAFLKKVPGFDNASDPGTDEHWLALYRATTSQLETTYLLAPPSQKGGILEDLAALVEQYKDQGNGK